jgi:septum site-determining protein MinD
VTARVITITSGKGGVGKTTTTANIGVALALQGKRVVCMDADIGLRNLDVVLGLENRIVYDLVDVIEGRAKLRQAMIKDKRLPDLHLLPASQKRDKSAVKPENLIQVCAELAVDHDFILIDSAAGIEEGFRTALAPSSEVIIVTNPEVSAVRDADRVIGLVEAAEKGPARLVVNRLKPELVQRGDMLDTGDVLEILAIDLLGVVPEDEAILVSTNRGNPAALDTRSRAGMAFRNIARRMLGEDIPFESYRETAGFLRRLTRLFQSDGRSG